MTGCPRSPERLSRVFATGVTRRLGWPSGRRLGHRGTAECIRHRASCPRRPQTSTPGAGGRGPRRGPQACARSMSFTSLVSKSANHRAASLATRDGYIRPLVAAMTWANPEPKDVAGVCGSQGCSNPAGGLRNLTVILKPPQNDQNRKPSCLFRFFDRNQTPVCSSGRGPWGQGDGDGSWELSQIRKRSSCGWHKMRRDLTACSKIAPEPLA